MHIEQFFYVTLTITCMPVCVVVVLVLFLRRNTQLMKARRWELTIAQCTHTIVSLLVFNMQRIIGMNKVNCFAHIVMKELTVSALDQGSGFSRGSGCFC